MKVLDWQQLSLRRHICENGHRRFFYWGMPDKSRRCIVCGRLTVKEDKK